MINIIDVGKVRRYKSRGYVLINTVTESVEMHSSYSWPELQYIGDTKTAYYLWKKFGITEFYPNQEYTPATINKNTIDRAKDLLKYGDELVPQLQQAKVCCIGWSPENQKWYGWSHRAIYGFGIGSECKPGHCHYMPKDEDDFIRESIRFWSEDYHEDVHFDSYGEQDGLKGVWIKWTCSSNIPNEKMRGQTDGVFSVFPDEWGKGSWTAQTLEDAEQMARDFAEGVG